MKALESDKTLEIYSVNDNGQKGILLDEFPGFVSFYLKVNLDW